MKKTKLSALEYPLVLRRVLNDLVISVPDLGYWKSVSLENSGENPANSANESKMEDLAESFWTPSPEFEQRVLEAIKQTWVYIEDHTQNKRWVPDPSTIRETLQKAEKRDFTLPEFTEKVREHMQISENTIRREIKRGVIQCYQTEGGHRRIPHQELELYLYRCRNIDSGL